MSTAVRQSLDCPRAALLLLLVGSVAGHADELVVGSKRFTESYILGEIAAQTARAAGEGAVTHAQGLGNTAIVFEALKNGNIHLYPDYTGTVGRELLKTDATNLESLNRGLAPLGLGVAVLLGFNNTYALAMLDAQAEKRGLRRLIDLAANPDLRLGLSHEFLNRNDGWPGLQRAYKLPQQPTGLDHGLAYEAIASGQIDVMDIYSTDAKIGRYKLRVLSDDERYFPEYQALFVYRLDVPQRFPKAWAALRKLEGRISERDMIAMNAQAELEGKPFAAVAEQFLGGDTGRTGAGRRGASCDACSARASGGSPHST